MNFFWIKHDFSHLTVCRGIVITCRSKNHMDQCRVRAYVNVRPQSLVLNVDEPPRGKVFIPISHKLRLMAHLCLPRAGNLPTPPPGREILCRLAGAQKFCVNTAIMVFGVGEKNKVPVVSDGRILDRNLDFVFHIKSQWKDGLNFIIANSPY